VGISLPSGVTATIGQFVIQNSTYGIDNQGNLTLNNSTIRTNNKDYSNGIYNHFGTMTLNNSTVSGNTAGYSGTGIAMYYGTMTLNNSAVSDIIGTGIYNNNGTMTLNNTTVSGNKGGGILNNGTLTLQNSTVSGNSSSGTGGGIYNYDTLTLQNTIIAGNTAHASPDCFGGTIVSGGYNLIGNKTGCPFTANTGDLTNVNAKLGQLIGSPGYVPLLLGSPAINTGNPATCLATDQRGIARPQDGICDMGAYEYTTPGAAASIAYYAGTNQSAPTAGIYHIRFSVYVMDGMGSPVAGKAVTFTAPASGASGTFTNTHTRIATVLTNGSGFAVAPAFTVNTVPGSYNLSATTTGVPGSVTFALTNLSVPSIISPVEKAGTLTPVYQWSKVAGATQYEFQLWASGRLWYAKTVASSVCGSTTCSYAPKVLLKFLGSYKWKVRAKVGGVWRSFTPYTIFYVVIKAGLWKSSWIQFYVSPNNNSLSRFQMTIYVYGCGYYTIRNNPSAIFNGTYFAFTGTNSSPFGAWGFFHDPTHVSGALGVEHYYLPHCGYITGSASWSATWNSSSQPAAINIVEDAPWVVEPLAEAPTAPDGYWTVKREGQ
jgi:hypothetical protein